MKEIIINWLSKYFELILIINVFSQDFIKTKAIKLILGILLILSIYSVIKTKKRHYSKTFLISIIILIIILLYFGFIRII